LPASAGKFLRTLFFAHSGAKGKISLAPLPLFVGVRFFSAAQATNARFENRREHYERPAAVKQNFMKKEGLRTSEGGMMIA
jgi:hypothetical protein